MPLSKKHKQESRARIVEAARILFNRHGFQKVTIDMVMQEAGLTRGGFYNHFASKEALFAAAVEAFLMGRGAQWRADAKIDMGNLSPAMARQMVEAYLSTEHLGDLDGQCPMIALPSDVARAGEGVQASFQTLLEAMVWLFQTSLKDDPDARDKALSMAALCIGGMVIARTIETAEIADEIRSAALATALEVTQAAAPTR